MLFADIPTFYNYDYFKNGIKYTIFRELTKEALLHKKKHNCITTIVLSSAFH